MEVSIWYVIGSWVLELILGSIWFARALSGTLKIDRSNPDKDVYRFDVDNLDKLPKKKYIVLAVDKNADLSQE